MKISKLISIILLALLPSLLVSCAKPRPHNTENICSIFSQYPRWYRHAKHAQDKWGVPIAVQMSIIYQESSFNARARPARKHLLWIIPLKRPSSAYGYSQALNNTWNDYQKQTGNGRGKRHAFDDACDFIGWYGNAAQRKLHIAPTNAYALYLAYHEGLGGYAKRSYLTQPWLIKASRRVANRAVIYQKQLNKCEGNFNKAWWSLGPPRPDGFAK
jgi:hypothetical protein